MFVNINVRDFDLSELVPTNRNKTTWPMADKSVPRTFSLLHLSLSAQSNALPFIK